MSHPSWFSPTNDISSISSPNFLVTDIKRMRSLWLISFIQDMRNLMSMSLQLYRDGLSMFPALYDAVFFIRADFDADATFFSSASSPPLKTAYSSSDYDRLASVFSICLMLQESVSVTFGSPALTATSNDKNALAVLNMSLLSAPNT